MRPSQPSDLCTGAELLWPTYALHVRLHEHWLYLLPFPGRGLDLQARVHTVFLRTGDQ